jgi:hypothetical protein
MPSSTPIANSVSATTPSRTRELPCGHDPASTLWIGLNRTCVELVLRAMPDEASLNSTLRRLQRPLHLPHGVALHAASTLYMRLITDPSTLQTYHSDLRQQFYASFDLALNGALLGSDQWVIESGPVKPAAD